jgi:hypothetical protein
MLSSYSKFRHTSPQLEALHTKHQNLYESSTELPLEFPDGTTTIASNDSLLQQ